jgi:hypothetical protein
MINNSTGTAKMTTLLICFFCVPEIDTGCAGFKTADSVLAGIPFPFSIAPFKLLLLTSPGVFPKNSEKQVLK